MYDHLSELAQRLGRHMAEQCVDGMPGHFDDELLEAFSDATRDEVKIALAELKADGLVELSPVIGPKLPRIRTTYDLFVAADPAVTGHDPEADAVVLARMMAEDTKLGHVPSLEERTGWPRRRFNPAVGLLLQLFPKGRYREVIQNEYPTLGFLITEDEVVSLQRFVRANTR